MLVLVLVLTQPRRGSCGLILYRQARHSGVSPFSSIFRRGSSIKFKFCKIYLHLSCSVCFCHFLSGMFLVLLETESPVERQGWAEEDLNCRQTAPPATAHRTGCTGRRVSPDEERSPPDHTAPDCRYSDMLDMLPTIMKCFMQK